MEVMMNNHPNMGTPPKSTLKPRLSSQKSKRYGKDPAPKMPGQKVPSVKGTMKGKGATK
jgi:hypothetical protein